MKMALGLVTVCLWCFPQMSLLFDEAGSLLVVHNGQRISKCPTDGAIVSSQAFACSVNLT